jgi:hypothetical protein
MKKRNVAAFIMTIAVISLVSCTTAPFQPVVEGRDMEKPVDLAKLRSAIRIALGIFNWRVMSETNSEFVAEFSKGSNDEVQATIKVDYSDSGYKIEYVDSKGLHADLEHMTIHRNYVRWVNNLDKQIYLNYYK